MRVNFYWFAQPMCWVGLHPLKSALVRKPGEAEFKFCCVACHKQRTLQHYNYPTIDDCVNENRRR